MPNGKPHGLGGLNYIFFNEMINIIHIKVQF